jgi:hypothetical protein
MLEYQEIRVGKVNYGLQAEKPYPGITDKVLPASPNLPAGTAGTKRFPTRLRFFRFHDDPHHIASRRETLWQSATCSNA